MFFIGVMGTGNKEKTIVEIPNITCKACGSLGQYTVIKRYHYVHVFFIPLWKWNVEYYVKERTCKTIFRLGTEAGVLIEKGDRHEILPEDLQELYPVRRCESCGGILEEKFVYCPYCSKNEKIINVGKSAINIFYNAPTVIIVSGKKEVSSALVDCSAAIQNMLIAAESIGLGTVWVGFVRFFFELGNEIEKLNLPDGYEPFYAVAVGYKENESISGPSKRNREVISYIR